MLRGPMLLGLVRLIVVALAIGAMAPGQAVAQTARQMYWTDSGTQTIQRANLDGTGVQSVIKGLFFPDGLALDVAGGRLYWTEPGLHQIERANLDGTEVQDLVKGLSDPLGLALDVAGGKMYWADAGTHKIQRANLDGTGVQDLVTGLGAPYGLALDLSVGALAYDFQPTKAVCRNLTTKQKVTITMPPGSLFLDCAAAGLKVNSGDRLKVTITGAEP